MMGPRHYSRGNLNSCKGTILELISFNGATTLQSWKRIHVEPILHVEMLSFNGATTLQSWKHHEYENLHYHDVYVSMGPRHYSRGNTSSSVKDTDVSSGFNGATTLQSWKHFHRTKEEKALLSFNGATTLQSWKLEIAEKHKFAGLMFQWGHDITVVETLYFLVVYLFV